MEFSVSGEPMGQFCSMPLGSEMSAAVSSATSSHPCAPALICSRSA